MLTEMTFNLIHDFSGPVAIDEVDSDAGFTETTGTSDTVQIRFEIRFAIGCCRQVVIDHDRHLFDVDT